MPDQSTPGGVKEGRSTSLRAKILRRILPPLFLMLVVVGIGGYSIIRRHGILAYDQQLADSALALSRYITFGGYDSRGHAIIQMNLTKDAEDILRTDRHDSVYWAVRDGEGRTVGGDPELPGIPEDAQSLEDGTYFISTVRGQQVRVGVFIYRVGESSATVVMAETRNKRRQLALDIALGLLAPEILLAAGLLMVIWYAVRSALEPLERLRKELQQRSHSDLRPLAEFPVVEEVQPLVLEINNLLCRLEQGAESQQRFLANAAHQLRTPLAGLKTQLELTLADTDHEARQRRLEQCRNATERTARLVNQLLTLSAAEPGGQGRRPWALTDLTEIVSARADEWVRRAIDRDIDFGLELKKAFLVGDPLLLGELAANLVDNAIAYSPRGGRVTVSCGQDQGGCFLSVSDNGPGIPPEARERVFERFFRLPGTLGIGSGLGLSIVREIAQRHGGEISIQDAPDEPTGTLVKVHFPGVAPKTSFRS